MNNDWKERLAQALLTARGIETQAQVAARASVSDRTIGLIESQKLKATPRPRTLARLAIATGSDPAEWLTWIDAAIKPSEIEALRGSMRMKVSWQELEPAADIKQKLQKYVDALIGKIERRLDKIELQLNTKINK